jgi:serine/threonine protein phosphatase PrpC
VSGQRQTNPKEVAPRAARGEGMLRFAARGASDVGRKRENNEDSFLVDEELGAFVVADGMGGHAGGGTASRLAVETIQAYLQQRRRDPELQRPDARLEDSPLPHLLREAVEAACMAIFQQALASPDLAGMGTTATALWLQGRYGFVAHVGDSRAYLLRGDGLVQLSEDHSLVNEQLRAGLISADEARRSRFKNVITRSVGFEEDVLADLMGIELSEGDLFLLCCDGLTNLVEDAEIQQLAMREPIESLPLRLIGMANDRGGDDNITVVAVKILEVP